MKWLILMNFQSIQKINQLNETKFQTISSSKCWDIVKIHHIGDIQNCNIVTDEVNHQLNKKKFTIWEARAGAKKIDKVEQTERSLPKVSHSLQLQKAAENAIIKGHVA